MAGARDRVMSLLEQSVTAFHPRPFIRSHCPFL